MNYDNISEEEARSELLSRDDVDNEKYDELENQIIEAGRVLYFLDAFGDFEMAVNVHVLPFDLPGGVIEEVANYDVLGGWQGKVEKLDCPVCGTELYEFDWKHDYIYLGKYGGNYSESVWFLTDSASYYWDTSGEHRVMCGPCANKRRNFTHRMDSHNGVKMFFGESDTWWPFSYENSVVRWDAEWYMDNESCEPINLRDKDDELVRPREVAEAFASSGWKPVDELMNRLGWREIVADDVTCSVSGIHSPTHYAGEVLEKWGSVKDSTEDEPTHPDFDFNYIIEDGYSLFVPEDELETVMYHLTDQVLYESNEMEQLEEHREKGVPV